VKRGRWKLSYGNGLDELQVAGTGLSAPANGEIKGTIARFVASNTRFVHTIERFKETIGERWYTNARFVDTIDRFKGTIAAKWYTNAPFVSTIAAIKNTIEPFVALNGAMAARLAPRRLALARRGVDRAGTLFGLMKTAVGQDLQDLQDAENEHCNEDPA
jgi:hypothetical protein